MGEVFLSWLDKTHWVLSNMQEYTDLLSSAVVTLVFGYILLGQACVLLISCSSFMQCISKRRLYNITDPGLPEEDLPGVTILKPLRGVDPLLETNLESHFTLKYPKFEFLLCVKDENDPAVELVRRLQSRYPSVDSKLFIGGKAGVLNPLIQNIAPGYDAAKYDIVWVSTARIQATTEILMDMIGKILNPKVALVHQLGYTTDQEGFVAALEKVYFATKVARVWLTGDMLDLSCIMGMSYLVKKPELDKLEGLSWFGKFLSEDFYIAEYLHQRGFRHQVAAMPARQNVGEISLSDYRARRIRWLKLRMYMLPGQTMLEPMSHCIPLGVGMSWFVSTVLGWNPYTWFTVHFLLWIMFEYYLLNKYQNGPLPFSKLCFLTAWFVTEVLYIVNYVEALLDPSSVKWGGKIYKQFNRGEIQEVFEAKKMK